MFDYKELRRTHGSKVSQTLDSPIMFLDIWELSEVMQALASILIFGVVFYSWFFLMLALAWSLVLSPQIKKRHHRGIFFHWPYRKFGMKLPGVFNPGINKTYSD